MVMAGVKLKELHIHVMQRLFEVIRVKLALAEFTTYIHLLNLSVSVCLGIKPQDQIVSAMPLVRGHIIP